jgi:hypothetical protein
MNLGRTQIIWWWLEPWELGFRTLGALSYVFEWCFLCGPIEVRRFRRTPRKER